MKKILFLVNIFLAQLSFSQTKPFDDKFPAIDRFIDSTLVAWNVPGLTMSIVYKDQLIYAKGYGFRDLEKKLPVETSTLFPIASNTKLFTATLASMLHHENKLSLDKPVKTYLPLINFSTDDLNAKTTIRDMLSHRTGLPRYDGIWINASFTRKELLSKISYMKPQLGFREGYLYNNMMYVAAGAAMEEITGKSWESLLRERIFKPLQMNASCFSDEEMKKYGNYSLAYFLPDSSANLKPKKYEVQNEALGPAGTIRSTATDMANWMIAQMNAGNFKGQQPISAKAIKETMIPNNISDKEGKYDELSNAIYCMGRNIYSYKGHKVTSHGGAIDGFYSSVTLFTNDSIGIFVADNASHGRFLSNFIPLHIFDRLMGLQVTPWNERYMKEYKDGLTQAKKAEDSIKATQVRNTVPSHNLNDFTGVYSNSAYGEIKIEMEDNKLVFVFRKLRSILRNFHYDQFITEENGTDVPKYMLNFITNGKGEIETIRSTVVGDLMVEFIRKKE